MRQRYLRLISALLLLAVLAACGTDRFGMPDGDSARICWEIH